MRLLSNKSFIILLAVWLGLAVLMRIVPHAPNLSPFASLIMVMGCQLSRRVSVVVTVIALIISDVLLSYLLGYGMFGSWTLFTYSGFALVAVSSAWLRKRQRFAPVLAYGSTAVLSYWVWTNFGTWFLGGIYPHSAAGLLACFEAGLPFLQHSAISALIFMPIFLGLIRFTKPLTQNMTAL